MAIRSMTAYARKSVSTPLGHFVLEIHSVNRKQLDLNFLIPKELLSLEMELRKLVQEQIARGRVTVRLFSQGEGEKLTDSFNLSRLQRLKNELEQSAVALGYDKSAIDFHFLISQLCSGTKEMQLDQIENQEPFFELLKGTLKEFTQMREVEGKALLIDIELQLSIIEKELEFVVKTAPKTPFRFRQKLEERIKEAFGFEVSKDLDYRLLQEVALLSEKVDISEEIARLRSHLSQFRSSLQCGKVGIGRTLEFLVQELMREINTMAAKTADSEISLATVSMRGACDKVREQVLNIE